MLRRGAIKPIYLISILTGTFVIYFLTIVSMQMRGQGRVKCVIRNDNSTDKLSTFVPRHIHQMFFGVDGPMPQRFYDASVTWSRNNHGYKYTLWNKAMVEELIDGTYPELRRLYDSYGHWVRRVDLARLLILYHHGGVIIDMDIKCKNDITNLVYQLSGNKEVGFYKTKPFGVSCDFIFARPKSQLIGDLVCGLWASNNNYLLPYLTTMLSTGPLYLSTRLAATDKKDKILLMDETELSSYVEHIDGATWHQLDGKIIWWTFVHIKLVGKVIICIVALLATYKIYSVFKHIVKRRRMDFKSNAA